MRSNSNLRSGMRKWVLQMAPILTEGLRAPLVSTGNHQLNEMVEMISLLNNFHKILLQPKQVRKQPIPKEVPFYPK
jgi:hypothetical protein